MKIKTLLLLGLSTFMLCPTEAKTMNPETTPVYYCDGGNVPSGYEIIVLRGDLLLNTELRLAPAMIALGSVFNNKSPLKTMISYPEGTLPPSQ